MCFFSPYSLSPLPYSPPFSPPHSPSPLIPSHPFCPSTSPPLCLLKVWILGEYSHTGYDARCTTSLLVQYFEVGETMFYSVQKLLMRRLILCALPPPSLFRLPSSFPFFPTLLPSSFPPTLSPIDLSSPPLSLHSSSTPFPPFSSPFFLYTSLSYFPFSFLPTPFFLDIRVYSV